MKKKKAESTTLGSANMMKNVIDLSKSDNPVKRGTTSAKDLLIRNYYFYFQIKMTTVIQFIEVIFHFTVHICRLN